jgi:hypothetical protein
MADIVEKGGRGGEMGWEEESPDATFLESCAQVAFELSCSSSGAFFRLNSDLVLSAHTIYNAMKQSTCSNSYDDLLFPAISQGATKNLCEAFGKLA